MRPLSVWLSQLQNSIRQLAHGLLPHGLLPHGLYPDGSRRGPARRRHARRRHARTAEQLECRTLLTGSRFLYSSNALESQTVNLRVLTDAPVIGDQQVKISVSGQGVTADDYTLTDSAILIPDGSSNGSVTLEITDDNLVERISEIFEIAVTNVSDGLTSDGSESARLFVTDNDFAEIKIHETTVSESDGVAQVNVTLSQPVDAEISVGIQIEEATADSSDFTGGTFLLTLLPGETQKTIGSQWYPPTELEPGDWNWHVRPIFADGSYGAFSRVGRFVVNLRITELIGNTGDPDFGIAWTPFPGSSEYEMYVRYADGSVMTFRTITNEFRYADQPAMEDGVWSFWVRPLDTYAGTWSAMRPLVVQSPGSLTSSPKLAYEATADPYPVFDWETADGASAYEIEIRTYVNSHIGDRYSRVRVTDSSWKSEERFAFTEHTWRVRVFDQDGDPGSWSAPAAIVVHPYSVLKAPLGSTTSTTPQFVWTEDSRATHYFLYVEDENGNEILFEKELTGTTYIHDVPFAPGTYRAWVKTIRSADIERSWSPPLDFQIV